MSLAELFELIRWDWRINNGASWDALRSRLLLIEVRLEQFWYRRLFPNPGVIGRFLWLFIRGPGSLFQWALCNANIPGTIPIGRGLRLPHPQNIIITGWAALGEFCTIYQNVTIGLNSFQLNQTGFPKIGNRVLVGTGVIVLGNITIGSDVLIGAGTMVSINVPDNSRVTGGKAQVVAWHGVGETAVAGSAQHVQDPYSIWREAT